MRSLWLLVLVTGLAGQGALAGDAPVDLGAATQGWINATRAAAGRAPLAVSDALARAAAAHARDIARTGRFSHTGRDGSGIGDRVRRQGYDYCFAAENIAWGQATTDEALREWMASPSHRRNLLSPRAAEFGLVRVAGRVWVMVLGRTGC
ncbi:MAG: CAP domain-containing protein [Roseovarius sp.]